VIRATIGGMNQTVGPITKSTAASSAALRDPERNQLAVRRVAPVPEMPRRALDERADAADVRQCEHRRHHRHRHEQEHLHEVAGGRAPRSAEHRDDHDDHPGDDHRLLELEPERGGEEDRQPVQPQRRLEDAERDLQPGEELLVGRAEASSDGVHRGHAAHLPEDRREVEVVEQEGERVAEKDDQDDWPVEVRLAGVRDERERGKIRHERARADDPPEHLAAAAEIVARVLDETLEHPPQ
jgi:hypothetical protein